MTTYSYTKSPLSIDRLSLEIRSSAISIALDHITALGTAVDLVFKADISDSEKTILDALVTAHSGIPLPVDVQPVSIQSQPSINVASSPTPPAFNAKIVLVNGATKNLFKRHTGIQAQVYQAGPTDIFFTILYAQCKITGASIINGESLDTINLYILDTDTNTYSQAPVNVVGANYKLNQFGFNVNVAKDYFQNTNQYDADLYVGMKIKISYTSKSNKTVGINIDLHEVK